MMEPNARDATLALLAARASGSTICPSEVARMMVAGGPEEARDWRDAMPEVHHAIDRLVEERLVRLSWKGKALATRQGPYRISDGNVGPRRTDG